MSSKSIIESDDEVNTVECVNVSSETIRFEIEKVKYRLGPKDRVVLHKNYATPRVMQPERDPVPSTIELLTNNKVLPITHPRARAALGLKKSASE